MQPLIDALTKGINSMNVDAELALLAASKLKEQKLGQEFYGSTQAALQAVSPSSLLPQNASPFLNQAKTQGTAQQPAAPAA